MFSTVIDQFAYCLRLTVLRFCMGLRGIWSRLFYRSNVIIFHMH